MTRYKVVPDSFAIWVEASDSEQAEKKGQVLLQSALENRGMEYHWRDIVAFDKDEPDEGYEEVSVDP